MRHLIVLLKRLRASKFNRTKTHRASKVVMLMKYYTGCDRRAFAEQDNILCRKLKWLFFTEI